MASGSGPAARQCVELRARSRTPVGAGWCRARWPVRKISSVPCRSATTAPRGLGALITVRGRGAGWRRSMVLTCGSRGCGVWRRGRKRGVVVRQRSPMRWWTHMISDRVAEAVEVAEKRGSTRGVSERATGPTWKVVLEQPPSRYPCACARRRCVVCTALGALAVCRPVWPGPELAVPVLVGAFGQGNGAVDLVSTPGSAGGGWDSAAALNGLCRRDAGGPAAAASSVRPLPLCPSNRARRGQVSHRADARAAAERRGARSRR